MRSEKPASWASFQGLPPTGKFRSSVENREPFNEFCRENNGDLMRRTLTLVTAAILICLTTLTSSNVLRAQTDAPTAYKTKCILCHAADGSGNSPTGKALKAKDLASKEIQAKSDQELAEVIGKGKGKMPAFGAKLKGDDIKQLVAYIRTLPKKS
jgi:mono/diheme cytochrome c family protein